VTPSLPSLPQEPRGDFQLEGFKLTGPYLSSDASEKWTVTITWMPVPADQG
jgi:hypothetical protein